jgi:hypothetical protein
MEDVLLGAVAESMAAKGEPRSPAIYCREPGATTEWAVYRPGGATDNYLIALYDAGIAVAVGEALDGAALLGRGTGGRRYETILLERNASTFFPAFDRLPPPEQALAHVRAAQPTATNVGD